MGPQEGILSQLISRVEDGLGMLRRTEAFLKVIASVARLKWLQTFGNAVASIMLQIQTSVFETYTLVLSINEKMTWLTIQSMMIQGHCIVHDALGRHLPLHVQFINSWDAFDAILAIYFRERPGYKKVTDRDFILQDSHTHRDINRLHPFDRSVRSGQQLNMSILFRTHTESTAVTGDGTCPSCLAPRSQPDVDLQWYSPPT